MGHEVTPARGVACTIDESYYNNSKTHTTKSKRGIPPPAMLVRLLLLCGIAAAPNPDSSIGRSIDASAAAARAAAARAAAATVAASSPMGDPLPRHFYQERPWPRPATLVDVRSDSTWQGALDLASASGDQDQAGSPLLPAGRLTRYLVEPSNADRSESSDSNSDEYGGDGDWELKERMVLLDEGESDFVQAVHIDRWPMSLSPLADRDLRDPLFDWVLQREGRV